MIQSSVLLVIEEVGENLTAQLFRKKKSAIYDGGQRTRNSSLS